MANLRARYGEELNAPQSYPPREWPHVRKFAHQFAAIHAFVAQESAAAHETTSPAEGDPRPA